MMRSRQALLLLVLALALGQGLGASCHPPPDPDARAEDAQAIALDDWRRDALDCSRSGGDCADWFHFDTSGAGTLHVDLAKLQDEGETPVFSIALGDARGELLQEVPNLQRTRLRLVHPPVGGSTAGGRYTLVVRTPEEGDAAFGYELRVRFTPEPQVKRAPRAPRFEAVRAQLLEVETGVDGSEAVLIDKGSQAGIARGQRGRLLQGGRKIADIEIRDVYPDGSRAVIRGGVSGALTPATVAEVDVPL